MVRNCNPAPPRSTRPIKSWNDSWPKRAKSHACLSDQIVAMREQLKSANQQVAQIQTQFQDAAQRTEAMSASLKKRVGASIGTNNSLQNNLPRIDLPGVETRVDGDVIRIELPGNRLFEPNSARLTPQATSLIDQVAAEVYRAYPNQIIGVEGHTSTDPVPAGHWTSNHHLSVGEAVAVYDQLAVVDGSRPTSSSSSVTGRIIPSCPTARRKESSATNVSSWSSIPTAPPANSGLFSCLRRFVELREKTRVPGG